MRKLSRREREVFGLLADGLSGAEIAERLVLSPETVRTHIRNGMAKLGASTRSQAVVIALGRREIAAGEASAQRGAPSVPAPGDVAEIFAGIIDGLLELWDVDAGWLYLAAEDGMGLRRAVERVPEGGAGLPRSIALGEGAIGGAALERQTQVLQAPGAQTGAMLVAPLVASDRLVGVLALAIRPGRPTGRQEILLVQALSSRLAELIGRGTPNLADAAHQALAGFRASWTAAARTA